MTTPAEEIAWMQILDQIDRSLHQSLERTPEVSAMPLELADNWAMQQLQQRLADWDTQLARIGQQASEAEQSLASEEAALREWQQQATATRELLGRALGRSLNGSAVGPKPATAVGSRYYPPAT
jgi:uncharacterized protein involved in exopolysaccharide biosynthesis